MGSWHPFERVYFISGVTHYFLGGPQPEGRSLILPLIVGIIERTLYFAAAGLGNYEAIGGWLALKAVAKFAETTTATQKGTPSSDPLTTYYLYTAGTGLSLIIGIGAALWVRYTMNLDLMPK